MTTQALARVLNTPKAIGCTSFLSTSRESGLAIAMTVPKTIQRPAIAALLAKDLEFIGFSVVMGGLVLIPSVRSLHIYFSHSSRVAGIDVSIYTQNPAL
jgi:hypothetical protein